MFETSLSGKRHISSAFIESFSYPPEIADLHRSTKRFTSIGGSKAIFDAVSDSS